MKNNRNIYLSLDARTFKMALIDSNWSVRDLAKAVGTSERTLHRCLEDGRIGLSLGTRICMVLGSNAEDVYGRQDPALMDTLRSTILQ